MVEKALLSLSGHFSGKQAKWFYFGSRLQKTSLSDFNQTLHTFVKAPEKVCECVSTSTNHYGTGGREKYATNGHF